jgi:hypothetical protein
MGMGITQEISLNSKVPIIHDEVLMGDQWSGLSVVGVPCRHY